MDVQTPEAPSELFRDWQRTQTQSSATAGKARGSEWMSGPAKAGTTRREAHMRTVGSGMNIPARFSKARVSGSVFSLDFDLHGCRRTGSWTAHL